MAQFETYNTVWSFTHPDAGNAISTGIDYRLVSDPGGQSEFDIMQALFDAIDPIIQADYLPLIATDFQLVQIEMFNHNAPQFGATFAVGQSGGISGQSVALRSAPVVSKRSALRGRSFRGRFYLMAPTEPDQSNGVLTGTYRTNIESFLSNMLSVIDATTGFAFNAEIWSTKLNLGTPVTEFILRRTMGGQRKRQKAE